MNRFETSRRAVKIEEESTLERESELLSQNIEKTQDELRQIDSDKLSEEDKKSLASKLYEILAIAGGLSGMALLSLEVAVRLTYPDASVDAGEAAVILGGLAGVIPYIIHKAGKSG